ncbi:hypothetical protein ACN27J_32975 [Solwaraspora sp. WMMB762]|uniref:hypothetical protein n=1 Tax=Solwaraspora sp. WMMB762 TaxID=3404120 RepID=UPI003B962E6A
MHTSPEDDATLVHDGQIVLRQRDGHIAINTDWPGWHEILTLHWYRDGFLGQSHADQRHLPRRNPQS